MTKMEEEEMIGGETKAAVPTSNQTTSPSSKEGGGGARFCGDLSPQIKADPDAPMSCAGCNEQILDKYYMRVDGKSWHERCVCCAACRQPLAESCYSKNCKLYCREDYRRLQYCNRCTRTITGEELVMRVGANSYHVGCFSCDYCSRQLHSGDHFHFLSESVKQKICCKGCYDIDDVSVPKSPDSDSEESQSDVFSPGLPVPPTHLHLPSVHQHYLPAEYGPMPHHHQAVLPHGNNGKSPSSSSMSDPKRSKRPRTILTTAQRRKFKASFEISQKPCRKVRETLANETGLTPRVVQVWFQNQRAKIKKIARRQSQGEGGGRRGKRKKCADSDSENEVPSSPGSYTSAPTPHQAQYYADYQSPSSIQTSPTSNQESSITGYYTTAQHLQGVNHSEVPYDDYDTRSHAPMDEGYIHQAPPPIVTSHIEMQRMLHEREMHFDHRMTSQEIMHHHHHDDVIHPHHDDVHSHHDDVTPHLAIGYHSSTEQDSFTPQRHLQPIDLSHEHPLESAATTDVSNPIDSLMFMQNNYFRT